MAITKKNDLSILVIDHEASILDQTVGILTKLGYDKTETVDNGDTALGSLGSKATPYDLIICDLNIPKMGGIEFIRLAKDKHFEGGIILLSGEAYGLSACNHRGSWPESKATGSGIDRNTGIDRCIGVYGSNDADADEKLRALHR